MLTKNIDAVELVNNTNESEWKAYLYVAGGYRSVIEVLFLKAAEDNGYNITGDLTSAIRDRLESVK